MGYFRADTDATWLSPLKYPPLRAEALLNVMRKLRSAPPFNTAVAGAVALLADPLNPSLKVGSVRV